MSTFNLLTTTAHLTRDPELRYTPKGAAVLDLGIATNHVTVDGDGNKREEVWFGGAKAFGKQAETMARWFRKGQPITLVGRLATESWQDKSTGQPKSATRLIVERFHFVPGYDYGEGRAPAVAPPKSAPAQPPPVSSAADRLHAGDPDDEIPI